MNIAVNLGRLGRWAYEGRTNRLNQFLEETQSYIDQLEKAPKSTRFQQTFNVFREEFKQIKNNARDALWAETAFTWANILIHRARLA